MLYARLDGSAGSRPPRAPGDEPAAPIDDPPPGPRTPPAETPPKACITSG